MTAAFADRLGEAGLAAAEFLHQPAIGLCLLERRQILALKVLDQCDFERLRIRDRANDDRDLMQPETLRGTPPPLAGNKLEIRLFSSQRPHQQRLEDPFLSDRLSESFELRLGEAAPRLEHPRPDQLDRNATLRHRVGEGVAIPLAEQHREAAAELTSCRAPAHRAAVPVRRNTSAASRM